MKPLNSDVTSRSAFTLIETLLALALSSALLVAVFGLVDSTVTYHVTGSDQVLVSQRTIGLLRDLRFDVRAVQADPHWQAIPELPTDFDERLEAAKTRLNSQLRIADMEKFAEPIRLAGQGDWLLLTLAQANPRWPGDATNFQQIVWSLGGRGSINVATHDNNGRATSQLVPSVPQAALVRTRIPTTSGKPSAVQSNVVVAAVDLRFRFLADGRWHTSWNSSTEKRLPDAVEVNLQLAGDAEYRTWIIHTASLHTPAKVVK